MTQALQQQLDMRAPNERAERDDPRNALLDTMARQIVDMLESAVEHEVIEPLLGRLEVAAPALIKRLERLKEAAAAADAAAVVSEAPSGCPAGSRPLGASIDHELRLARVLAALKLGHPKTAAARDLLDGAKMIVLSDLAALRAARSLIGARRLGSDMAPGDSACAEPAARREDEAEQAGLGACQFTFIVDDAGSGE